MLSETRKKSGGLQSDTETGSKRNRLDCIMSAKGGPGDEAHGALGAPLAPDSHTVDDDLGPGPRRVAGGGGGMDFVIPGAGLDPPPETAVRGGGVWKKNELIGMKRRINI